jgi:hypothetical protein
MAVEQFGANPFGILTFIVAPAILTNASSVMALGTSNRFARAIDRARMLATQIEGQDVTDEKIAPIYRRLQYTERRSQLLVQSLTAFYLSVGSFAAASLISLLGAVFFIVHHETLHEITQVIAFCAGVIGVGGLVAGSGLLVTETRLTLRILRDETKRLCETKHVRNAAMN